MGSNVLNQAKVAEMVAETNAALPRGFRLQLEARPAGKRVCEIAIKGFDCDSQGIVRSLRGCSQFLDAWRAAVEWCLMGGHDIWRHLDIAKKGSKFAVVEVDDGPYPKGHVYASFATKAEAEAYVNGMISAT